MIRGAAPMGSGEGSLPRCRLSTACCVLTRELSLGTNLIHEGSILMT